MATKNETLISELKINYLTEELYAEALANGQINNDEIYMTPGSDLSIYATKEELENKADEVHTHEISDINELQSKLDEKQKTITGAATTIANSNLTTNRALVSNASGKVIVSAVTSTELGYLDGVTANVQTQLDGKASDSHTHTKSQITDFPSSLKNPNSLTIQGNGTTLTNGVYDGSAAKTVNITPSSIGAATSSHIHTEYAESSHGTHVSFTTTTPKMDGTASVGTASTVSRSDHVHPSDTNKADKTHTHDEYALENHTHDGYMSSTDPTGTGSLSVGRQSGSTIGTCSTALGYHTIASGNYSHSEGQGEVKVSGSVSFYKGATGIASHTEGYQCDATARASHAEGYSSAATGESSHAEGWNTTASGGNSHAEGNNTTASGSCSHAGGYNTTALDYQHVFGHYNGTSTAGAMNTTVGDAFIIGNGASLSAKSNACRITYAGAVIGKAAYQSTGADYAEYFEWADGNTENEERIGYFVTFDDGEFIRKANEGEYILGIVSGNPAVLGNNDECWRGQNEMDEWNRFIYVTETDEETGETYETYKVNPDYDNTIQYIPRADRPEWDAVGMIGVLSVRDDGTCKVNGYCKVADGGIATASDTGYRVIKRVTDNIIKVVFR